MPGGTYYKATSKHSLNGIKRFGLDPKRAGGIGGATAIALVSTGRVPTALDRNHTWLGSRSQAETYAGSVLINTTPVILKIDIPDWFNDRHVQPHSTAGHTTLHRIPPDWISFEYQRGSYLPIFHYDGRNEYSIPDREDSDVDDSDDDW